MLTTFVIGATSYSGSGVAYSGFSGTTMAWADANLFGAKLQLDDETYSTLEFTVIGCGPAIPFPPATPVAVVTSNDDGTSPVLRFAGDLISPDQRRCVQGAAWGYLARDLKWRGDQITLLSNAGLPVATYNLAISDPQYLFSQAGKTVGQICIDLLQAASNAANLDAVGVGNYAVSGGVYTLPSQTLSDLGALNIVPKEPVQLQGEAILSRLQSFVQHWMAQNTLYVEPDGTIRVAPIFGRPSETLTTPSALVVGDPIDELAYRIDLDGCFAAVLIAGQDIAWVTASVKDGTLTPAWTLTQQNRWTSSSFTSPQNFDNKNNANDDGVLSGVTTTSCTVTSDFGAVHWDTNYWSNNGGVIQVINPAVPGIDIQETKQVTSNTAMAPGGSATVTWDTSVALASTAYTRYRLYAMNTPDSLVDRAFLFTEPGASLPNTGLHTYIGSHMVAYSPFSYAWANQGKGAPSAANINYPACVVLWSSTGKPPFDVGAIQVNLDPSTGQLILSEPAVFVSAMYAGQGAGLGNAYPKTFYQGLWTDVQIAFPFNRGNINARYPSSGFSGTANSKYGVTRVKVIPNAGFTFAGDTASLQALAQQHLLSVQDAVTEGSVHLHWDAWTPTFDVFELGRAIGIATPGAASDIDGLDLPVRSVTIEWPDSGPDIHSVSFRFSNRHRAFEGDSLYLHPSFSPDGWGAQGGDLFVGGNVGGMSGSVGMSDFNAMAASPPPQPGREPGDEGAGEGQPDVVAMSGGPAGPAPRKRDAFSKMGLKSNSQSRKEATERRVAERKAAPRKAKEEKQARQEAATQEIADHGAADSRTVPEPEVGGAQHDRPARLADLRGRRADNEQGGE